MPRRALAAALAIVTLAGLLPSAPTLAQGLAGRGLPPSLTAAGRSWMAIGRLDIAPTAAAGGGFCSATLIAEDRALTAAHCVFDPASGQALPLAAMRVHLGLQNGRAETSRGVRAVATAGWLPVAGISSHPAEISARVPADLAVLWLDQPVRLPQLVPIRPAEVAPDEGRSLAVVSYARGRSEVAALQGDCLLIARRGDGALVLDCQVDHGASGAPVMALDGGEARLVGVISARAETALAGFPNATVALAAPLDSPAARALLTAAPAAPAPEPGTVRIRRPEAATGGARFLRP